MSNNWGAGFLFPSRLAADGSGLTTGTGTVYPLTWTLRQMMSIEWTWKQVTAQLTGGSLIASDFFGSTEYAIPDLEASDTSPATNWRELVPGPAGSGFPPARTWHAGAATEIVTDILGGVIVVTLDVFFSELYRLSSDSYTKKLTLSVTAAISSGSARATASAASAGPGDPAGAWTAFGKPVPYAAQATDSGEGLTLVWGTIPTIVVTAPPPFIPSPGVIG